MSGFSLQLSWLRQALLVIAEQQDAQRATTRPLSSGPWVSIEEARALAAAGAASGEVDSVVLRAARASLSLPSDDHELDDHFSEACQRLRLDPAEQLTVIAALAPEVDRSFERLYAFVNDDITRQGATVGAIEQLIEFAYPEADRRAPFRADAPLRRFRIVKLADDATSPSGVRTRFTVNVDEHVSDVLLTGPTVIAPELAGAAALVAPAAGCNGASSELTRLIERTPAVTVAVSGIHFDELIERLTATALTRELALIRADGQLLAQDDAGRLLTVLAREAILQRAAVVIAVPRFDEESAGRLARQRFAAAVHGAFASHPLPVFLHDDGAAFQTSGLRYDAALTIAPSSFRSRVQQWQSTTEIAVTEEQATRLAGAFPFPAGGIAASARDAGLRATAAGGRPPNFEDLQAAARHRAMPSLQGGGRLVEPQRNWNDIVLPSKTTAQLREIADRSRNHQLVIDDWGFGSKLPYGRANAALFVGDPGTGKTMAAEVIAAEIGVDLLKVDLSAIVSKYIGETEKNVSQIFRVANSGSVVLFFDEADALFAKRTEVRDSHDRYANVEVSHLLQEIEEYDGVVLLSSNLRSNIDDAFIRRLSYIVEFPFPQPPDRAEIFRRLLSGTTVPLAEDVDTDMLAERYELSGAGIRNVVLTAAFLAAAQGQPMDSAALHTAVKTEYSKLGRLISDQDFAPA